MIQKKEKKTHRLATSKANPDIALEAYTITRWEFESIKRGCQSSIFRVIVPVTKNSWVFRASIFIGDFILGIIAICIACNGVT